jgi:hypothetical protein
MPIQVLAQPGRIFRVHLLRSIRLSVAVATAVALLTVLATSSALAADSKTFIGVKDCNTTPSPPDPGGFCIFTQSNLNILRNARVYYTNPDPVALAAGVLSSPVILRAVDHRGSTATGHCTFYIDTVKGLGVFWSGTAKLAGFQATIVVTGVIPDTNVYSLTGTYWFDRDLDGEDDNAHV